MDTCMCMAESICCLPEIITALLISSTPIQNKKFFYFCFLKKRKETCFLKSIPKVDIFLFYFLGGFGSRLVFTLTLPPPSPSCKILCFGVFEKFPIATDW